MNRGRRSEKIFRDRHDGMHGNGGQVILKSNKESMTHGLISITSSPFSKMLIVNLKIASIR
jgi:hypothetical protein